MARNELVNLWIKGLLIFVVIWLVNYIVRNVDFISKYLMPIDITTASIIMLTDFKFLLSLLVYPLIIGFALGMIEKKVR